MEYKQLHHPCIGSQDSAKAGFDQSLLQFSNKQQIQICK